MNRIFKIFELLDIYKTSPYLLFNRERFISSNVSKILSLVFISFFLYCLMNNGITVFSQSNFQIADYEIQNQDNHITSLNTTNFMLALKFYNKYNDNNINDYLKTRTNIYFTRNKNITEGEKGLSWDDQNEFCTQDHFSAETKTQFDNFQLQNALCLQKDYLAQLNSDNNMQLMIVFNLNDIDNDCISFYNGKENKNDLCNQVGWNDMQVYVSNNQFFPKNKTNKQIITIQNFQTIILSNENTFEYELQEYEFNLKDSIFPIIQQDKLFKGIVFDRSKQYKTFSKAYNFGASLNIINFKISDKTRMLTYTYQNLSDLIILTISQIKVVSIICVVIATFYNEKLYMLLVAGKQNKQEYSHGLKDIFNGLDLENHLTKEQILQVEQAIDIEKLTKHEKEINQMKQLLFSKKTDFIFEILKYPQKDLNSIIEQYIEFAKQNPKQFTEDQKQIASKYLSSKIAQQNMIRPTSNNFVNNEKELYKSSQQVVNQEQKKSISYVEIKIKEQPVKEFNLQARKEIEKEFNIDMEMFKKYLIELLSLNRTNVIKNQLDLIVISQFFQVLNQKNYKNGFSIEKQQMRCIKLIDEMKQ